MTKQQGFQNKPLDVLIVGAGLSGICAAAHLSRTCPDKQYAVLEARSAIGGTWDLFRYPGIRSDSDMYTLSYGFKPWKGMKAIADGADIRAYIEEAAKENGVTPKIRFGHKVLAAAWSSTDACWSVTAEASSVDGGSEVVVLRTRILYLCSGYYSYAQGHRPDFPGEDEFKGRFVHPQFWPQDLDYSGKNIVVIGSGATAVTLVPSLAKTAAHVTMLQRSPSYVAYRPEVDASAHKFQRWLPAQSAHIATRWKNVLVGMFYYRLARQRPEFFKNQLLEMTKRQLGSKSDIRHFTPSYKPWDQRVCVVPNGDLFKAIRKGAASVVTDTIGHFTPSGIKLASGQELPADIVVTATGLKLNVLGDVQFTIDGKSVAPNKALTYKGMMLSGMPNCVLAFGYVNSSWTLKAELTAEYVCRLLRYMDRKHFTVATPRRDADVEELPFLSIESGYVQRAIDILPKQGSRKPWQVYQNYLQDKLAIQFSRVNDGTMQFR